MKRLIPSCVALLMAGSAAAQYRPPPPTEAQQLVHDADAERAEAAKLDGAGNRAGAAGRYAKAIELYEKSLTIDPEGPAMMSAAGGLGAACVATKAWARAVKDLQPIHSAHADAAEVSFYLGLSLFKLNRFADALPLLEPLARADAPEHFMVHYYLGSYALSLRDGAKAVEELSQFIKRRPAELAAGDAQVGELIGRGYLLSRRPVEAKSAFERANQQQPSTTAQLGIAAALEMEGKSAESLSLVEGMAKRDPRNAEVMDRLARMYLQRGQLPRAAEVATELVRVARSAQSLILYGDVRSAQKDWRAAEPQYREALKLAPKSNAPLLGLARALEQLGRHEEAITELERVAGDGEPAVLGALGSSYRRAGHYQKALETHLKLQKQTPRDVQSLLLLGADHFAVGQWDEAVSDYSSALEIDATNARARHCLVLALSRRAQLRAGGQLRDAALFDLRRAYDLEPSELLAQSLAAIQLGQEKWGEADHTLAERAAAPNAPWQTQLLYAYALLGGQKAKDALPLFEKLTDSVQDAAGQSWVDLGWALSKVQLDDFEPAARRLTGAKRSLAAAQSNLPLIVLKLGWQRLGEGDVAGATRELAALTAAPPIKGTPAAQLFELEKGLIAVENKQYAPALSEIRAALAEKQPWFEPAARPLIEAYIDYRLGKLAEARKQLAAAVKHAPPGRLPFAVKLAHAIDEREAEQLYTQNAATAQPRIEKLLKGVADSDAAESRVQNNLSCTRYRKGAGMAQSVATWKTLAPKLPEAELNLGLHALQQEHDARTALSRFRRYAASGGARSGQAREWVERLQQLYGADSSDGEAR